MDIIVYFHFLFIIYFDLILIITIINAILLELFIHLFQISQFIYSHFIIIYYQFHY